MEKEWLLFFEDFKFGILLFICGMFFVIVIVMFVVIFIGLVCVVFLSEYVLNSVWKILKLMLELLVGILIIVYGFFVLIVVILFL